MSLKWKLLVQYLCIGTWIFLCKITNLDSFEVNFSLLHTNKCWQHFFKVVFRRSGEIICPGNFGDVENRPKPGFLQGMSSASSPGSSADWPPIIQGCFALTRGISAPSLPLQGQSSSAALTMSKNEKSSIWRKKKKKRLNFYWAHIQPM